MNVRKAPLSEEQKLTLLQILTDAGTIDDSHCLNHNLNYQRERFTCVCPHCQRGFRPLCSMNTQAIRQGNDEGRPWTTYAATCTGCKKQFRFTAMTQSCQSISKAS